MMFLESTGQHPPDICARGRVLRWPPASVRVTNVVSNVETTAFVLPLPGAVRAGRSFASRDPMA